MQDITIFMLGMCAGVTFTALIVLFFEFRSKEELNSENKPKKEDS